MIYNRLIALNRYTRNDIEALGYDRPKEQSVICVGNIMARKKLEVNIRASIPTTVVGHGRHTAILEICDRLNLDHKDSFDGKLFNRLPFIKRKTVFIVRHPKMSKLLKEYIKGDVCIVIIGDKSYTKEVVTLKKVTSTQIKEYEKIKGYPMIRYNGKTAIEREEQLVARHLKGEHIFPLPKNTHRWIAHAFSNNENVLTICSLAERTKNPLYYHGILSLIRYKKSLKLRYPTWVKRK